MKLRTRPVDLLSRAWFAVLTLLVLLVTSTTFGVVSAAAASASASPTPVKKPLVNWGWLAFGLGGVILLLLVMLLLTRVFASRQGNRQ
jgi:hypothetical protein